MPKKKNVGPCSVIGCGDPIDIHFMCRKHYYRTWRFGSPAPIRAGNKRNHPLYSIWNERKSRGSLCAEWASDIFAMAATVGERPSPTHLLRRPDPQKPYGPDNWMWFPAIRREEGESRTAFIARKWASRRERDPENERRRHRLRTYGLTEADYTAMLRKQKGVCAICKLPERVVDHKTGVIKNLSVDHCHATGKVRALLCWKCNAVLGKANDSIEMLQAMIRYLRKYG